MHASYLLCLCAVALGPGEEAVARDLTNVAGVQLLLGDSQLALAQVPAGTVQQRVELRYIDSAGAFWVVLNDEWHRKR